ncbi:MAG: alkylhydroperoxidase [Desulfurococcales archaeon ex4484_58]|nr:MAG: alkylhydroperoxidase [Desulfurococcales archaeon ex4484_58]
MKKLIEEFHEYVKYWRRVSPDQVNGFLNLLEKVETPKALDKRIKELIAVALAVNAHCPWCIAYHVNEALKNGATPDEIREAAWVAVLMGGGPNLSYMILVEKAIKEFTK